MIVDPVQAFATASVPLATSSVAPVPTVVPSLPTYEKASETGNRTLWYVNTIVCSCVYGLATLCELRGRSKAIARLAKPLRPEPELSGTAGHELYQLRERTS